MSEILSAGGNVLVLGLGAIGAVVALLLAGVAFMKKRVPLTAFIFFPILVCAAGAFGAWSSAGTIFSSLESAPANELNQAALSGLWAALTVDWASRWIAAFVLVIGAWAAGVGATIAAGPAEETRFTPVAAGVTALLSLLFSFGLSSYGVKHGLGTEAYMLAGVLLAGGLGLAFASTRRALYEHSHRVAGMRFASAVCMVLAVVYGSRAVSMGTQIKMFGPGGTTNSVELTEAVRQWTTVADPMWYVSWGAFALVLIIAFGAIYSELGEIVERFTLIDVWGALVLVGLLATVRVVEESRTHALAAVGTHGPARGIFKQWGTDLSSGVVTIDKKGFNASPANGGYGDILAYQDFPFGVDEKGNPLTTREWRRTWAWNGSSWDYDGSPLSCEGHPAGCTTPTISSTRIPLIAIGKSETATEILGLADVLPNKEFMLLLRLSGVEAEGDNAAAPDVPEQLAHKQLGFIPIKMNAPVDLKKEIWVDAGYKQMFWGPTHWFGEAETKDPIFYTDAIFEETEAAGVDVVITEKARVEGIAGSCVASLVSFVDGKVIPNDKWCNIKAGDVEEWRAQAREVWEIPQPENVTLKIKVDGPEKDAKVTVAQETLDHIADVFARETGAIGFCQEQAYKKAIEDYDEEDPESELAPTAGKMELSVVINDRGRVNGTYVEEKSKLKNSDISRCAAKRYRKLSFEPLPKAEKVEGEERPPAPKVTVWLTYNFKDLPNEE